MHMLTELPLLCQPHIIEILYSGILHFWKHSSATAQLSAGDAAHLRSTITENISIW